MNFDAKRAFAFLDQIGFVRTAGSEEELRAAKMIQAECAAIGVDAVIEEFTIQSGEVEVAELEVLEPYQQKYTCTGYKRCMDADNLEAELVYVENAGDAALADVKGKIVLLNTPPRLGVFKELLKAEVAGFIAMTGTMRDTEDDSDLPTGMLRKTLTAFGKLPAVSIRMTDAFDMISRGACKVRMTVKGKETELTSRNVVAEIPGTKFPEQIISMGAHYDSVPFSTGVYDNGAGSVILLEALRHFKENPPARTIKFMWYGSEEVGLEGSKAYVRDHEDELKKHLFMVNVDVAGPVIGAEKALVMASEELTNFTNIYFKTRGYNVEVKQDIYSSDSIPYADKGVPGINFCRFGIPGSAYIHNRHDVIKYLSADALEKTIAYTMDFTDLLANCVAFPTKREVPKEIVEKVDKYLFKKDMEEAKKLAEEKAAAEKKD
ncbi:MAG: M20/M25/M40 family metallo-hydrolase [Oscillospiraceae bacterium]|nr:M20/M25/M40 family metallo-hydrolase [Oscillospiraceae bacterium]